MARPEPGGEALLETMEKVTCLAGGVGAAIGIFLSDMLTHGMPLLSLSVGVTSNFIAFYI